MWVRGSKTWLRGWSKIDHPAPGGDAGRGGGAASVDGLRPVRFLHNLFFSPGVAPERAGLDLMRLRRRRSCARWCAWRMRKPRPSGSSASTTQSGRTVGWTIGPRRSLPHRAVRRVTMDRPAGTRRREVPREALDYHLRWTKLPGAGQVAPVAPSRKNERLLNQRGFFLCPGSIEDRFEDNLRETLSPGTDLKVICLPPSFRTECIQSLWQMNLDMRMLYPDLSGFAQSLRDLVHVEIDGTDVRFEEELKRSISSSPWDSYPQ
jgi:hypothetical protein